MDNDSFKKLADLYGFAPSRALRELLDATAALERERCAVAGFHACVWQEDAVRVRDAIRARGQA